MQLFKKFLRKQEWGFILEKNLFHAHGFFFLFFPLHLSFGWSARHSDLWNGMSQGEVVDWHQGCGRNSSFPKEAANGIMRALEFKKAFGQSHTSCVCKYRNECAVDCTFFAEVAYQIQHTPEKREEISVRGSKRIRGEKI
jgi:hypothetical protein